MFVGPLTNLAVALLLEPQLPRMVARLVIMGGAFFGPGNVTEDAEFNVYVDPHAAALVADADFSATWIGLDVTHQTSLSREDWARLAGSTDAGGTLLREVCRQSFEARGNDRVFLHDPLAIAVAEDPSLVGLESGEIIVEVRERTRGRTRIAVGQQGTGGAASEVDVDRFREMFSRVYSG